MTYDQDVDVAGVFGRIYQLFVGHVPTQPGILEAAYAFGVAAGILLFFNPFVSAAKRKAPLLLKLKWRNMNQISGIRLSKLIIG